MERRSALAAAEVQPLQPHAEAVATRPAPEPVAPIDEAVTPATIELYQRDDTASPPPAGTEAQPEPQPAARTIEDRDEPVTVVPVVAELRATDEPPAPRAASIIGAIKGLFRAVAKAITRESEDEPRPKPVKRRGETEGEFKRLVRFISRRFDVRRQFRQRAAITSRFITIPVEARATAYLADTLDQLSQLDDEINNGDDYGGTLDAISQRIFPQP